MLYKPVVDLRVYRFSLVFCYTRDREDCKAETMSYKTITINEIQVIGKIWLPPVTSAMTYKLSDHDIEKIGELTRENVEKWLRVNSGDFQCVDDFRADIGDFLSDWSNPDSEEVWCDCMYTKEYKED